MKYQIRIEGELEPEWADWLGGSAVAREGDNVTLLTCALVDQAALHGLIRKIRDFGLTLVSLQRVETQSENEENVMINSKTNARVTGVLFILGTVPPVITLSLWGPLVSSPDYLSTMAANSAQVLLLALSDMLFLGFACAGIGISLYPVLRRYGEGPALGAAGFRIIEGALQIVSAIILVALLAVSREFVRAGSPPDSTFQSAGAAIKTVGDWASNGTAVFPWCISAAIYYTIFYRTRLVPRWLSGWGLLGLALFLASAFAVMFGVLGSFSPIQMLLSLPIMVQEMVLAVWLIVNGYRD